MASSLILPVSFLLRLGGWQLLYPGKMDIGFQFCQIVRDGFVQPPGNHRIRSIHS